MQNKIRNIYFVLVCLPVISLIIALLSSDFSKGYFPSWVYTVTIISNVASLVTIVLYMYFAH